MQLDQVKAVWIVYKNWRGEVGARSIKPIDVFFGKSAFHGGEPQWLMNAWDESKESLRTFALADILSISPTQYQEPPNFDVVLKAAAAGHPLARLLMDALSDWAKETGRPMADKYRELAAGLVEAGSL